MGNEMRKSEKSEDSDTIKIVVLGDSGTGKSSLVNFFINSRRIEERNTEDTQTNVYANGKERNTEDMQTNVYANGKERNTEDTQTNVYANGKERNTEDTQTNLDANVEERNTEDTLTNLDAIQTVDVKSKKFTSQKNEIIMHIYDIADRKDFEHLGRLNYAGSDVALFCFSLDSKMSLDHVASRWITEFRQACPDIPIILVGTKRDLMDNARTIQKFVKGHVGRQMVTDYNLTDYFECSNKTGEGVVEVFKEAAKAGLRDMANKRKNNS